MAPMRYVLIAAACLTLGLSANHRQEGAANSERAKTAEAYNAQQKFIKDGAATATFTRTPVPKVATATPTKTTEPK